MAYNHKEYMEKYRKSPIGKYKRQKKSAEHRGIYWEFTFESWFRKWQDSEKWKERGTHRGGYVMTRIGDTGPYSPENTIIKTGQQNNQESWDVRKIKQNTSEKRDSFYLEPRNHLPLEEQAWFYSNKSNWY